MEIPAWIRPQILPLENVPPVGRCNCNCSGGAGAGSGNAEDEMEINN
jgi:hypothetical protein